MKDMVTKILQTSTFLCMMLSVAILTCYAGEASTVKSASHIIDDSSAAEFRMGMEAYQKQQYSSALKFFRQAAGQGDVEAIVQMGLMYDFGRGVCQNYNEAMRWYLKAAEKGEPRAMYLVGHMYEFGEGVSVNTDEAFSWYLKSARLGHASAQFEIGKALTRSSPDTHRYQEGIKWLQLAAGQCHPKAADLLQSVTNLPFDTSICAGG